MDGLKQLFPSWRYHRDGRAVIVKNPDEDAHLGPGWADSPAAFPAGIGAKGPAEPVAQPEHIPAPEPLGAAHQTRQDSAGAKQSAKRK